MHRSFPTQAFLDSLRNEENSPALVRLETDRPAVQITARAAAGTRVFSRRSPHTL